MNNVNEQAKIQGGNKMNNQTNQPKISLWKCECTNCGDARSIKITQGLTPRYCSQCGSETNYQEVAENESGEKKNSQDARSRVIFRKASRRKTYHKSN
ncbi:MAG: hypothetical protein ACLRQX_08775 [Turicibacter sanguinis]